VTGAIVTIARSVAAEPDGDTQRTFIGRARDAATPSGAPPGYFGGRSAEVEADA
jgi:hypothetical protein